MRKARIRENIEFLKILLPMMAKELPQELAKQLWADKYWLAGLLIVSWLSIYLIVDPLLQYFGVTLGNWIYNLSGAIAGMFCLNVKSAWEQATSDMGKVYKIPGWRLGRILRMIYGERIYKRAVEPHLSDHQMEYVEALAANNRTLAFWIWIRCLMRLALTAIAQLPISLTRICVQLWKITAP